MSAQIAQWGLTTVKAVFAGGMALAAGFATVFAIVVFLRAYRSMDEGGMPGYAWQALLFAFVLDLLGAAAFDVAKANGFVIQGWGAVVGVVTALFGGWLGYRATTKISGGGVTIEGERK